MEVRFSHSDYFGIATGALNFEQDFHIAYECA